MHTIPLVQWLSWVFPTKKERKYLWLCGGLTNQTQNQLQCELANSRLSWRLTRILAVWRLNQPNTEAVCPKSVVTVDFLSKTWHNKSERTLPKFVYTPTYHLGPRVRALKVRHPFPPLVMLPTCSACFFLFMFCVGLCPFSGLFCDLLPWQSFWSLAKGVLLEEYLSHNLNEHCLEDTGPVVPYQP